MVTACAAGTVAAPSSAAFAHVRALRRVSAADLGSVMEPHAELSDPALKPELLCASAPVGVDFFG